MNKNKSFVGLNFGLQPIVTHDVLFQYFVEIFKLVLSFGISYFFNYYYLAKPLFCYVTFWPQKWVPFFSILVIARVVSHLLLFIPFNLLRFAYILSKLFFFRLRYLLDNFTELSLFYFIRFCIFFLFIFIVRFWLPKSSKHYFNLMGFVLWQFCIFLLSVISRKYGSLCFFTFLFLLLVLEVNFLPSSSIIFPVVNCMQFENLPLPERFALASYDMRGYVDEVVSELDKISKIVRLEYAKHISKSGYDLLTGMKLNQLVYQLNTLNLNLVSLSDYYINAWHTSTFINDDGSRNFQATVDRFSKLDKRLHENFFKKVMPLMTKHIDLTQQRLQLLKINNLDSQVQKLVTILQTMPVPTPEMFRTKERADRISFNLNSCLDYSLVHRLRALEKESAAGFQIPDKIIPKRLTKEQRRSLIMRNQLEVRFPDLHTYKETIAKEMTKKRGVVSFLPKTQLPTHTSIGRHVNTPYIYPHNYITSINNQNMVIPKLVDNKDRNLLFSKANPNLVANARVFIPSNFPLTPAQPRHNVPIVSLSQVPGVPVSPLLNFNLKEPVPFIFDTPTPVPTPTPAPLFPTPVPTSTPAPAPLFPTPVPTLTPTPAPLFLTPVLSLSPKHTFFPTPVLTPTPAPLSPTPVPDLHLHLTPAPLFPTPVPTLTPTPAPLSPTPVPAPTPTPAPLFPTPVPTLTPTPAPLFLTPVLSLSPKHTFFPTPVLTPTPAPLFPTPVPTPFPLSHLHHYSLRQYQL